MHVPSQMIILHTCSYTVNALKFRTLFEKIHVPIELVQLQLLPFFQGNFEYIYIYPLVSSIFRGQMISNEDFQFISKFDNATADMRQAMLQEQQNKHQVNKE